jgi:hypothetical protein
MAAAIVPLIAGIAPSIISLITGLVHKSAPVAEAANGPGTGPVKFAQVLQSVMGALQSAASSGQIDKVLPSDDSIKLIIQSVINSMQMGGQLPASAAPLVPQTIGTLQSNPPTENLIVLKSGQTLRIQHD